MLLARSFIFLPGIGPVREARLWNRGVASWGDYRGAARVPGIKPRLKSQHDRILELAESCFDSDPAFFARNLPDQEHWRAFDTYGTRAAYVDIETTGDRANHVTVVGARFLGKDRAFVRGIDYSPKAVSDFLSTATCLVTFNGGPFDLPVLRNEGVQLPDVPHVDLRTVFTRIGYTGGLKKIEATLGVTREDGLEGLTGWDAVKLWRRWSSRQDQEALDTLVAYNVADCANLEPLARFAIDRLTSETLGRASGQQRLEDAPAPVTPTGR